MRTARPRTPGEPEDELPLVLARPTVVEVSSAIVHCGVCRHIESSHSDSDGVDGEMSCTECTESSDPCYLY